jgi:hypothetical protein
MFYYLMYKEMNIIKKIYNILWECYYRILYLAAKKQNKKLQKICEEQYQLILTLKTALELLNK